MEYTKYTTIDGPEPVCPGCRNRIHQTWYEVDEVSDGEEIYRRCESCGLSVEITVYKPRPMFRTRARPGSLPIGKDNRKE